MRREVKRRRFNEAVVNMLFPQPLSPPQLQPNEEEKEPVNVLREDFDADLIPETGYSTSDDNGDGEPVRPQQLTRAQRKRLRKKKLKEDACRRGKIIGPLLPSTSDDVGDPGGGDGDVVEKEPPAVRHSAAENKLDATTNKSGEKAAGVNQKKLKQRRMAKRLAKEGLKSSSSVENC
ncbi:hypothetical protein F2P56_013779 [Juglans regia]|uniref:Uncharacterized protein n=2 Tax=Juglans regia TaxID=51240 RepID=A0A833XBW8_JUGRE|nr:uncharacterized protein LOC108985641 isoform X2 [Juglans regia]KAF5463621.1 hypothetical protein F2P56_013779 [Juglans regia]